MARSAKRQDRGRLRLRETAIKAAVIGGLIVLLPVFLGGSALAPALRSLAPLGWVFLVAGAGGAWVLRQKPESIEPLAPETSVRPSSTRSARKPDRPPPAVERVAPSTPTAATVAPDIPSREVRWGPAVFAAIEWRRFEAVVEALFAQAGFRTQSQSHGADEGVDIWLYSANQPDGSPVSVVQCKHWQGKRVGVDKIRELRGVMAARGVQRGQFATTSTFTPDALAFGRVNGINLLDVEGLLALIAKRTPEQQRALLDVAYDGDYWRPTCVNCGVKMVEKTPRAGGNAFWGCVNFPSCRTTMVKSNSRQA